MPVEEAGRRMSMERGAQRWCGADEGPSQHLKRRSQSTKSRRAFSPSMLVKKTEDRVLETEICSPKHRPVSATLLSR